MSTQSPPPSKVDLEKLFINNPKLEKIRAHLSHFNPIKVMGMEGMEIRHSAILGWLLDPRENHGLGDQFLKGFLAEALRGDEKGPPPSALDVASSDMMDAEVRLEWQHIDLFVLCPNNRWAFVIENKYHSSQHGNQLTRYRETVERELKVEIENEAEDENKNEGKYKIRHIFLTLWKEKPNDEEYVPIRYKNIHEILSSLVEQTKNTLSQEINIFLNHYLNVIGEATGMNEEQRKMKKLARKLYRENKEVIDFITQHGRSTEFYGAAMDIFDEKESLESVTIGKNEFIYNYLREPYIGLLPKAWYKSLKEKMYKWPGCEKLNGGLGLPVVLWLRLLKNTNGTGGQIFLYAQFGPLSDPDRKIQKALVEAIKKAIASDSNLKIEFRPGSDPDAQKEPYFFKDEPISIDDVHDRNQIAGAMRDILSNFDNEIEAVGSFLPDFLKKVQKDPGLEKRETAKDSEQSTKDHTK